MNPKVINLNNIFKAPLFRALSIIAIFFTFLFVGEAFNAEKIDAADVDYTYVSSSSSTYSSAISGSASSAGTKDDKITVTIKKEQYRHFFYIKVDPEGTWKVQRLRTRYSGKTCDVNVTNEQTHTAEFEISSSYSSMGCGTYSSSGQAYFEIPWSYVNAFEFSVSYGVAGLDEDYLGFTFVDSAAPTVPTDYENASGGNWVGGGTQVAVWGSSDWFSGIKKYEYSYDKSTWYSDWDSGYINLGTWTAERNAKVYFRACDNAGNCSAATSWYTNIRIDRTTPDPNSTTISIKGTGALADGWTKSQTVNATISGWDSLSGIGYIAVYQGTTLLKESTSNIVNGSFNLINNSEGTHYLQIYICDVAGNCLGYSDVPVWLDRTAPTITSFSTTSGTTGTDGNKYVTADFNPTVKYSDNSGVIQGADLSGSNPYNLCYFNSNVDQVIGALSEFTPSVTCAASSLTVSYTTQRYALLQITDFAGNTSYAYIFFYRIDTSRMITISNFSMDGYGSQSLGWMGTQDLTSGKLAANYTLGNSSYLNKNYMLLRDEQNMSTLTGWLWTDFVQSATGITDTVKSGTYFNLESGYGGNMKTANWYNLIDDGDKHEFTIKFKNIYGQITSATAYLTFDLTNPTISSFSAADNDSSNNDITPSSGYTNSQTIKHSLSASDTNLYKYKILDGSTTIYSLSATSPNGASDSLANTTAGAHSLTAYAYDKAGNYASKTYSIIYDATDPTISAFSAADSDLSNNAISPASGYTNTLGVNYTLTASDTNIWKYKVLDGSTTINSLSTSKPSSGTMSNSTGAHTLTVYVYDKAGNGVSKTYSMTYLAPGNPTISAFSASDNDSSNDDTTPSSGYTNSQAIKYALTASGSELWKYKVLDGTSTIYDLSTTSFNGVGDSLANTTAGAHSLTAYVYDKAGNSATKTYSITYDATDPTISTFSAADSDLSNNAIDPASGYTNTLAVNYTLTASDTNIWKYKVLDGSTAINSISTSKPSSGTMSNSTGAHTLTVYVYDKAGNGSSKSYSMTYLPAPPTSTATISFSASDGDLSNNSIDPAAGFTNSQAILYSASATGTQLWKYKILDGSTTIYSLSTTSPSGSTGNLANTTAGAHTLTFYTYDKAGNAYSKSYDIIYWPPGTSGISSISAFSAADGDLSNNTYSPDAGYTNSQTIKYTLSVSGSYLWKYKVEDGSTTIYSLSTTSPNGVSDSLANTTNGKHTLKVYVYDKAGNCATATYGIVLDTVRPVVNVTINNTAKTATISFSDTYLKTSASIGTYFKYYLSKSDSLNLSGITMIAPTGSATTSGDKPMYISSESYYLYIATNQYTRDKAGNVPTSSGKIYMYGSDKGGYTGYVYKVDMSVNDGDYSNSSTPIDPDKLASDSKDKAVEKKIEVSLKHRVLTVTVAIEAHASAATGVVKTTLSEINEVLTTAGYTILGIGGSTTYAFTESYVYHDVLISKNDRTQNELIDLIIVIRRG